jgi:hypothetical protein
VAHAAPVVIRDVRICFTLCAYQVEPPLFGLTPSDSSLAAIDAQDLRAHLTRRRATLRDHPDAYRLRDVRGLRYGPIS